MVTALRCLLQPMPDPLETARLAKQRSIKILRSATFANMDLASIGAAAADTAPADSEPASHAATLDVQDHRPPIMAAAVSSAASAALTSMKVETSAAPVVQERRKTQVTAFVVALQMGRVDDLAASAGSLRSGSPARYDSLSGNSHCPFPIHKPLGHEEE